MQKEILTETFCYFAAVRVHHADLKIDQCDRVLITFNESLIFGCCNGAIFKMRNGESGMGEWGVG